MKVYVAAIDGLVPSQIVKAFSAFMDFCYIARRNALTPDDLRQLEAALAHFHEHQQIFKDLGIHDTLSLPRQHALKHYPRSIRLFGSPNGLCSSITESKHIKAVKEPWRRSNRYNAMSQMTASLSRIDKLTAAHQAFHARGMLMGSTADYTAMIADGIIPPGTEEIVTEEGEAEENSDLGPSEGPAALSSIKLAAMRERGYPRRIEDLARRIKEPRLLDSIRRFLWTLQNPDSNNSPLHIPLHACPNYTGKIYVHHSAIARFYAPSDICGAGGMHQERIRSNPQWFDKRSGRYDTVLVHTNEELPGMQGHMVAQVRLFFSLRLNGESISCALVNWFNLVGDAPDVDTGMWVVQPEYVGGRRPVQVIPLDSISRGIHLLPVYGARKLDEDFHFKYALDSFRRYYVNSYIDNHAHELLTAS
ncbi:hypothetical protein VNI00_017993 [Paramarasmius palmivorus]|uniref:Uncharacterized protein n=1 Tax=Paramarasmius palmivorus TaxID=297713 RepID=A0AAW0B544_9AGAR